MFVLISLSKYRFIILTGSTVQITDSQLPVDSASSSNVCQGSVPERSSTQCGESFSVSGVLHRICGEHGVATQQSSNLGEWHIMYYNGSGYEEQADSECVSDQ